MEGLKRWAGWSPLGNLFRADLEAKLVSQETVTSEWRWGTRRETSTDMTSGYEALAGKLKGLILSLALRVHVKLYLANTFR